MTRRGNYESKINSVLHSTRRFARRRTAFTRWPKHTRFYARAHICTHSYIAFVAFVTSCLPNSCKYVWIVRDGCGGSVRRWGGEREIGRRLAYSYVINIHELQPSRSVLLPLLCISSVRFFARFPTVSAQFFAKAKFYRVDEPRLHIESPQWGRHEYKSR